MSLHIITKRDGKGVIIEGNSQSMQMDIFIAQDLVVNVLDKIWELDADKYGSALIEEIADYVKHIENALDALERYIDHLPDEEYKKTQFFRDQYK